MSRRHSSTPLRIVLATLLFSSIAATVPSDTVVWSATHPLEWLDYQAHVPKGSEHAAVTYYSVRSNNKFLDWQHVAYEVTCVLVKSKSWVRPEHIGDTTLLGHERLHFDIAECNARVLRGELRKLMSVDDCVRRVQSVRDSVNSAWKLVQDQYDVETAHGTISKEQLKWRGRIEHTLDSLAEYVDSRFVVTFPQ